eukprot:TRINITY_DN1566_c0_g1_i1.p1 TRINITY_DN1566_c0_g1~~TRINITY_DN1566_c0_g1_i1.p1  ORF type:complete len:294 (+),score=67.57 TRINITY_DN1566_c0_g1_i1:332-1213(+)
MTFGDRTSEFAAVAQQLRQKEAIVVKPRVKESKAQQKISVNRAASEISHDTYEVAQKLKELMKLSKSRSLFDDPAERIEELTAIVKQDIQHIRGKIEALHTLMGSQRYQTAQMSEHSGTVIQTLNNNLMQATERFRKVLEVRTENLKSQQERKEKFIGSRRAGAVPVYQPFNPAMDADGGADDAPGDDDVSISLPLVQTRDQFLQQRSQSIRAVEGTINEIKGIFTELSVLTMQQDEMIRSIEDDLEDVSMNVEEGHKQLLQYLPKVAQNRWLYLKIFGVLLFFMILFLVFFV